MTKFALYVPLQAKPGKEKEVADFLRSALPLVNAEAGTISWFAIQEGPSSFAIFDTFDDEAGRDAHLSGKVAAALMEKAKAGDLFAKTPEIHQAGILRTSCRNKRCAAARGSSAGAAAGAEAPSGVR
jgi:quinol monooxygenase YgiN